MNLTELRQKKLNEISKEVEPYASFMRDMPSNIVLWLCLLTISGFITPEMPGWIRSGLTAITVYLLDAEIEEDGISPESGERSTSSPDNTEVNKS